MARSLNKVMLIGYIADEPVIRSTNNGGKVANVTLVTNERVKNQATNDWGDVPEWHRVVFWNRNADTVESFIHKGSRLYVEGHLKTSSYVDKTGVKRYSTEIVCDNMIMLDSRRDSNGGGDFYATNQVANVGGDYWGNNNNNNNNRFNGGNNSTYNSYSDGANRASPSQYKGYAGNDYPYQSQDSFAPANQSSFSNDSFASAPAPVNQTPFANTSFAPATSSSFAGDNFAPANPGPFASDNFAPASSGATSPSTPTQFPQAPAAPSPVVENGGGDDDIPF